MRGPLCVFHEYQVHEQIQKSIKFWCRERGLTQNELAKRIGMEKTNMSRLLNNHTISPTVKTLFKICHALQIQFADLFENVKVPDDDTFEAVAGEGYGPYPLKSPEFLRHRQEWREQFMKK